MNTLRITGAMVVLLALVACGGGGSTTVVTSTATGSVTQLSSANGELGRYLGAWSTPCLFVLGGRSAVNSFSLTSVNDAGLAGNFTQYQYVDSNCKVLSTVIGNPVQRQVALAYAGQITVGSSTTYAGTADQMHVTFTASSGAAEAQNLYFALRANDTRMVTSPSNSYGTTPLTYHRN